ncbi:MAG: hypothetical protein KME59_00330 [Trichormus sp. ATA11-4-KO1]|jgi:hypothetical protein|nr:hypothetical protein [Trichormus sp. ATA11-4-KO1]
MPTARYAVSAAMPVRALRQFLLGETPKTGLPHQRAVSPLRLNFHAQFATILRKSVLSSASVSNTGYIANKR